MTKSFLGADDRTLTITDNNQTVYGADGIQTVKIKTGATNIIIDSNIEKIYLDNTMSSYKFQQAGNQLKIFDSTDNLITQMGIRENGTPLTFANGTVPAAIFGDASGAHISVGGVMVNSTIATTLAITSIDSFLTSLASGIGFTLSVKEAGTPTAEGKAITFMVTPNAVIDKATTLSVDLVGQALNSITTKTSADDFYPSSPILFNVGDTAAKQITVMVKNDGNPEGMEAYKARLIDENGMEKNSVVGAIIDGVPILNFSANNGSVNEGGDSVNFTVTSDVSAPLGGIVIPYSLSGSSATSGVDFSVSAASGTITIPVGSKVGILKVQTKLDDHIIKAPETVTVTLGAISNATFNTNTATTTINDTSVVLESNKFFLSGSTSVNEGNTAIYTISHAVTNSAVTVNYAITNSNEIGKVNSNDYRDYTGASSGSLTFNVGETSKTLSVPITADLTTEGNEALTVTLSSPSPAIETIAAGQTSITTTVFDTSITSVNNSFTLTTAIESITGTTSDDVISAYIDASGTTDTLNASDTINGGVGNDTLLITVNGADAGTLPAATITSIETMSIRETGGVAGNYNLAGISDLTTVINNISSDDITFTGTSGKKLVIQGNGVSTNANTTFDNATDLTFKDGVKGGNVTRTATGGTVTLYSVGAENVLDTLDLDSATALNGLTINASTNFTATLSVDYAANSTLTVTGAAAKVDLSGAALSAAITNVYAANFSGGVMVQVNQADKIADTSFTGGNGDDTLDIGKVKYNTGLKVDGALGVDTLKISDQDTLSATVGNITNFERLEIYDDNDGSVDNFDVLSLKGITTIQIDADSVGDGYVLNNLSTSQAMNVIIAGNQTVAPVINVTNATLIGNIDTLGLTIDAGETGNAVTLSGINALGVELINVNAVDSFTAKSLIGLPALAIMTISGRGDINLTTGKLQLNLNSTIDATASTGMITVDASDATTTSATITGISIKGSLSQANFLTGSAQPDILTGGTGADLLNGGAGNDTLSGGANADMLNGGDGSDVINGGAGADAINGGAGVDTLNGGGGDDLFVYSAPADLFTTNALVDSISGGSGTNSLLLGTAGAAFAIAATDIWTTTRANGVDALIGVANSTANTFVLDKSAETAGVKLVDLSNNTALTGNIINVASFTVTNTALIGSAAGASLMVGGAGNDTIIGGAGSDTITSGSGSDVINITAGTDTITDFTSADSLNVSLGATAKISVAAIGGIVDVSGANVNNAGMLFIDGSAGTAAETITGSISADSITGGAGSDVITGGAGVDTMMGGAGADKFIITTSDTDTVAAAAVVTDIIADFKTSGSDTLSLGAVGVDHVGSVTESASVAFANFSSAATGTIIVAGLTVTSNGSSAYTAANIVSVITGGTVTGLTITGTLTGYTAASGATAGTVVFTSTIAATNITPDLSVAVTGAAIAPGTTITQGVSASGTISGVIELGNFVKASATVADLTTLLAAADTALTGLTKYYVGQVTAGDTYVVTDGDANGITDVIKLTGVALAGILFSDIVI
ncbi:MAG: Calx-beta domain-containing protein [Methylococcaceae bacterium]